MPQNTAQKKHYRKVMADPVLKAKKIEKRKRWLETPAGRAYTERINKRYVTDINERLKHYKRGAAIREKEWSISDEEARSLFRTACHYCKVPANPLNGIDRKENDQGYTPQNVVPCCGDCNMAKLRTPYTKFMAWIDRIVDSKK